MSIVREAIMRQVDKQIWELIDADNLADLVWVGLYGDAGVNAFKAFKSSALVNQIYQDWVNDNEQVSYPVAFNGNETREYQIAIDWPAIRQASEDASVRALAYEASQIEKRAGQSLGDRAREKDRLND